MNNTGPIKTLGIITIATGKYFEEFIPNLKASVDRHFSFPGYQINFYCFTDSTSEITGINNIPIEHFSWPFSTLLRYRWMEKYLPSLEENDFLLYMDADMRVVFLSLKLFIGSCLNSCLPSWIYRLPWRF